MVTRFWWIRHGPTHAKGMVGWRDIPADLSDVAGLARLEKGLPEGALLVSSDLVRSTATADAIEAGRTRLAHRKGLREMNFGDWDGVPFADIAKADPAGSRQFWEEPGAFAPPGGESWDVFSARVRGEIAALSAEHGDCDLVVVAHFAVILTAIQVAADLSAKQAFRFKIDNLSLTQLDHFADRDGWRVNRINHVL